MSIRRIEEFDADTSWMLLAEKIIPQRDNGALSSNTRRMASGARCPAYAWNMLHIALRWSAGNWTYRILSTCRSAGSRNLTPTRVGCYLLKELFQRGIMGCYQVTLAEWQAGQDAPPTEPWSILDIALLWSAGISTHRILSTCRSAGSRKCSPTRVECYLWNELFRRGIMGSYIPHLFLGFPVFIEIL